MGCCTPLHISTRSRRMSLACASFARMEHEPTVHSRYLREAARPLRLMRPEHMVCQAHIRYPKQALSLHCLYSSSMHMLSRPGVPYNLHALSQVAEVNEHVLHPPSSTAAYEAGRRTGVAGRCRRAAPARRGLHKSAPCCAPLQSMPAQYKAHMTLPCPFCRQSEALDVHKPLGEAA